MFEKVLVANRGEIAARVMRTCRRLGIRTVAVYSDADANALHVRLADEAVGIGPAPARDSYLRVAGLTDAIRATGASAVHPGYGLLSEDAGFAAAVADAGAVFIGPPPQALSTFGDKIAARQLAKQLGIATAPGTQVPVHTLSPSELEQVAAPLGYPILVKAAGGGGGIGMQPVASSSELAGAVATCSTRAKAAFADERVYLERYIARPRHIEVQVLAAGVGNARAVGLRECSVQRRHQKLIEEAPGVAPQLTPELRAELCRRAVALVGAVDYRGAATVEFMLDAADPSTDAYFLEVNARLQVEHPVTEFTTGLDLVEWQLRIAAGEAELPQVDAPSGAAIEARLCAEDPAKGFVPQPGTLDLLAWPLATADCRVDAGYETGDVVSSHYDSLLGKVIAWGPSREAARLRLLAALSEVRVELRGPKGARLTNLAFLQKLLSSDAFTQGAYDTHLVAEMS